LKRRHATLPIRGLTFIEPQVLQPRDDARQRHIGNHRLMQ